MAQRIFNTELSKPETDLWTAILTDCNPGEMQAAFVEHLKTALFFPKPAQILERIQLSRKEARVLQEQAQRQSERQTIQRDPRRRYGHWDVVHVLKLFVTSHLGKKRTSRGELIDQLDHDIDAHEAAQKGNHGND